MIEAGSQGKENPFDAEAVISGVKAGNRDAENALYDYLRGRFIPYFAQFFPEETEDLTQMTAFTVFRVLDRFENRGKGTFTENFRNWTQGVARWEAKRYRWKLANGLQVIHFSPGAECDEIENRAYKEQVRQHGNEAGQFQPVDLMPSLKDKLSGILPKSQMDVISLRLDKKSSAEIATQLGMSENAVEIRAFYARKKIEKEILFPAGYRRLNDIEDENLQNSIRRRSGEAVDFLGVLYVPGDIEETHQSARQPQKIRGQVDLEFMSDGYVLVSEKLTRYQYEALLNSSSAGLLVRKNGRMYIKEDDLLIFQQESPMKEPKKFVISGIECYTPYDLAQSSAEYHRFCAAIRKGSLSAIKNGKKSFVTKEAIEEFRNRKS